jgi:hypothetical protein
MRTSGLIRVVVSVCALGSFFGTSPAHGEAHILQADAQTYLVLGDRFGDVPIIDGQSLYGHYAIANAFGDKQSFGYAFAQGDAIANGKEFHVSSTARATGFQMSASAYTTASTVFEMEVVLEDTEVGEEITGQFAFEADGFMTTSPTSDLSYATASINFSLQSPVFAQAVVTRGSLDNRNDPENQSPLASGQYKAPPVTLYNGDTVIFRLTAEAAAAAGSYLPGGSADASVDYSHTFKWMGILDLKDSQGNPIDPSTFHLYDANGVDWSTPVPEPATLGLLMLSTVALLRRRRSCLKGDQ